LESQYQDTTFFEIGTRSADSIQTLPSWRHTLGLLSCPCVIVFFSLLLPAKVSSRLSVFLGLVKQLLPFSALGLFFPFLRRPLLIVPFHESRRAFCKAKIDCRLSLFFVSLFLWFLVPPVSETLRDKITVVPFIVETPLFLVVVQVALFSPFSVLPLPASLFLRIYDRRFRFCSPFSSEVFSSRLFFFPPFGNVISNHSSGLLAHSS